MNSDSDTAQAGIVAIHPPDDFRGAFRSDADALAVYSEAAGIARIFPRAVAVPADIADVQTLVRWAHRTATPLIPRGSGSSMSGGAIGDGVIVDLSRMNHIGDVDVAQRRITVGPGAVRGEVEKAARKVGLRFPPDPSSGAFATIGGMASTNASGAHTLKFGSTRAWVSALDCVFDDGSRATIARGEPLPGAIPAIQRLRDVDASLRASDTARPSVHTGVLKESSGYGLHAYMESGELVDLMVGSEGTLAIIVSVQLILTDVAGATSSLLGAFPTLEGAVHAAVGARNSGAVACELLDRTFLDVAAHAAAMLRIPAGTEAVLMAEVEGSNSDDAVIAAKTLGETFRVAGASTVTLALTPGDEEHMWELRHVASPILAKLGPSLTSMQFVEDGAVPPERLPEYVRGVRAILDRYGVKGVIFGHAGDSHMHVNPLIDVAAPHWRDTVQHVLNDVVHLTAQLGGTLSGEHGDGRLRTPLLSAVWPPEVLAAFRSIKEAFDPADIFNPGVKIVTDGERAIGDIKYDPSLAPLPPRAATAMARVYDDRAYDRFRLDLLDEPA
ncbi:MAG: FAD-binding oxidoreductase [Gemmatimonadaceae bacterium]